MFPTSSDQMWLAAPFLFLGSWLGWAVVFLSFGLYIFFQLLCGSYFKYQNLRERYKAEWALVTGASTGVSVAIGGGLMVCFAG